MVGNSTTGRGWIALMPSACKYGKRSMTSTGGAEHDPVCRVATTVANAGSVLAVRRRQRQRRTVTRQGASP